MIFDRNYDNILWLLIDGDKNNRDIIINFIKSIPSELLIKIQEAILEYNNYKLDKENKDYVGFNGDMYDKNGNLYSFNIDDDSDVLRLSRSTYNYGKYYNDFDLVLSSYNDIDQLSGYSKVILGYLSYNYKHVIYDNSVCLGDCTTINYDLVKLPFGSIVVSFNEDLLFKRRIGVVDTDNLNKDYTIDNVRDELVRSRKKNNRNF